MYCDENFTIDLTNSDFDEFEIEVKNSEFAETIAWVDPPQPAFDP